MSLTLSTQIGRILVCIVLSFAVVFVSACNAAQPTGEDRANAMLRASQMHFGVESVERMEREYRGLREVYFESPSVGRFATYRLATDGSLVEFIVNQPESGNTYVPVKDREAFIGRLMELAAPEASSAERHWGAKQLNMLWTPNSRPLAVQVGTYVFRGGRSMSHDNFKIVAAQPNEQALRFRPTHDQ